MSLAEQRKRYMTQESGWACFVNGTSYSPAQFMVRSMNFGQPWRTYGVTEVEYQAYLPKAFVKDYLEKELAAYVEDARQFPDFQDPLENRLRAKSWPSAREIFEDPHLATRVIKRFGYDILLEWFGTSPLEREPGFVINTIDRVSIENDTPCFVGKARTADIAVQYQDV